MSSAADRELVTDGPEKEVQMTFMEHLSELRSRLVRALLGIVPCVGVAWAFKELILELLMQPLAEAWGNLGLTGEPQLHFANPIDPFVGYLKLAIACGFIFATPWVFWQAWAFIAPGLWAREKRLVIPFSFFSTIFFAGGAFFGYLFVFPLAFETLLSIAGIVPTDGVGMQPTIMFTEYLGFSTRMLLAFGVTFEVPVVITFLAIARVVNWRQLWSFFRWWVLVSALLAALLTPPDVGSQLMMLLPLVLLYLVSIGLAFIFGERPPRVTKEELSPAEED